MPMRGLTKDQAKPESQTIAVNRLHIYCALEVFGWDWLRHGGNWSMSVRSGNYECGREELNETLTEFSPKGEDGVLANSG